MLKQIFIKLIIGMFLFVGMAQAVETVIISDTSIHSKIIKTIDRTIGLLSSLDNNTNYGELGWANSLTLNSAIGKLKQSILDVNTVNIEKMKKFSKKIKSYFSDYIVDDLNENGLAEYKIIMSQQEMIIAKATNHLRAMAK
jgi:uncharacterized membrane protein (DUF106 family)